jgi:multiple sugar transport system substrate-binding protein
VVAVASASAWTPAAPGADRPTLTVFWHAGSLADAAARISKQYTAETGVEIRWTTPPLTQAYYAQIADEFARRGAAFDLCIFDSQSMSEFASAGHVVKLNDLLAASPSLRAADFDRPRCGATRSTRTAPATSTRCR